MMVTARVGKRDCPRAGRASATQDQAGLVFVAAAYGLGFSGLLPSHGLAVRALFAASEATWREPLGLFTALSGMAFGAWRAGAIHDAVGLDAAAGRAGIAAGLVRIAPMVCRLLRQRREGSPAQAGRLAYRPPLSSMR
jgi:hypothetical protein